MVITTLLLTYGLPRRRDWACAVCHCQGRRAVRATRRRGLRLAIRSPQWFVTAHLTVYFERIHSALTIGSDLEIWAVNTDGGNRRRLVANAVDAAWSHDGTRLAFSRFNSAGVAELWYKDIGSGTETFVAAP
jgi:hypothetical protein